MAGPAEPPYTGLFDPSAFCPLGPLPGLSHLWIPQISFRGGEPEDQVPLGALMCLHLLCSSGHCETESYPTPCFPFDLYVTWEDKDCFVLSTLYLLSVQYSRNLNRWMDRSIDLYPGLLQVRLILMWKSKWSDMQNTSVNYVSSEKGSVIGMTMGWALV